MQWIRAPPTIVCRHVRAVVIIWQAQNGDPIRAYRSSKTPDKYMYVFSVIHKARGDTQASAWSRALANHCLVTCVLRNNINGV